MFIKKKILALFFFFFYFISISSISQTNEDVPLNNLAIKENPKQIQSVLFEDFSGKKLNLKDYRGKLLIINFWATWCAPCKEEMPSLDKLYQNDKFKNLEILAINIEKPNLSKTKDFFNDLNIKKLSIFFDVKFNFVNEFKLRGVPTTIFINKNGDHFASIIGSADFQDKNFVKWLSKYD